MPTLTKKQKEIFDFIKDYIKINGVAPTFEEIADHTGKAFSTVHEHVGELVTKGFLNKTDNSARGIELNKKPRNFVEIPLSGTIAAGQPIEAIEMLGNTITISKDELNKTGKHYALSVQGDSMINEGIFDGDIVVLREQNIADDGQTVVAIIDDNEATLKKIYREKNRFRLQPANPTLLPIFRRDVEIRGVVIKIIRDFDTDISEGDILMEEILKAPYTNNSKRIAKDSMKDIARPFLQWVGGKREMINNYIDLLPKKYNKYYEPFLGGGAMFFHLKPKEAILNDSNQELIKTYEGVRDNPQKVINYLKELKKRHSKNFYNKIRDIDRKFNLIELSNDEIAARMIYLNQTCFNGLYRVNKSGQFNVPIGSSLDRLICDNGAITNASALLKNTTIINKDFEDSLSTARKNDFVYLDPPYYPISKYSDFNRYTKEKFYKEDQERLKKVVDELSKKGVKVMLSNSDCEFINVLYSSYNIHKVLSTRNLNCKKDKRNKVSELIITNY